MLSALTAMNRSVVLCASVLPQAVALFEWDMQLEDSSCSAEMAANVVDLPDILLPEDQYLDMFDSESDTLYAAAGCRHCLLSVLHAHNPTCIVHRPATSPLC